MGSPVTTIWDTGGTRVSMWDTAGRIAWGGGGSTSITEQIAAARPTSFLHTWDIAQDGSRDYSTIAEACAAAKAVTVAENGPRQAGWASPYRRHRFRIWPGQYKEPNADFPSHFALIGMGDEPGDVRIWDDRGTPGSGGKDENGNKSGENIINTSGRSMWVENVWLDHASPDPEWHSIRIVGPSGDVGRTGYDRMTAVFSRVRMTSHFDGMAGKCAMDATITHYDVLMDRVWFDTPGQPQAINAHIGRSAAHPSSLIFYGCSVTAGYNFVDDPTLPNGGRFADGTIPGAIPVGIHDTHGGRDVAYWVEADESVWDVGRQAQAPDTPPRGALAVVKYAASASPMHISALPTIDNEAPSLIVRASTGEWLADPQEYTGHGNVDRVIPAAIPEFTIRDGAGGGEREFYGPNPADVPPPAVLSSEGGTRAVELPAGRVYFLPIPVANVGFQLRSIAWSLNSPHPIATATAYGDPDTGIPYSTAPRQMWVAGAVDASSGTAGVAPRWYYPGHGTIWVALATQGAVGEGHVVAQGGPQVYYADAYAGGTIPDIAELAPLPDGEPYPAVTVRRS